MTKRVHPNKGDLVRVLRPIESLGGLRIEKGAVVEVANRYRGRLALRRPEAINERISNVSPSDVKLVAERLA